MGETGFLATTVKPLFTFLLSQGTEFAEWIMATEPVNYFVGLSLVVATIYIVKGLIRR
ncbi:MAG: hypothetical protein PHU05_02330 [Bacilli bacterium]|nr:hypothetical protein [Bacilli bacterium]